MYQNSIKVLRWVVSLVLLPIVLSACGGGSSGGETPRSTGSLKVSGSISDKDVVLGGIHKYTVSLVNAENLVEPVAIDVTNSNPEVVRVESNTCATIPLLSNDTSRTCSFLVKGLVLGNAEIKVGSANYPTIALPLEVTRDWGTLSRPLNEDILSMAFIGGTMYILGGVSVYKYNGYEGWDIVGGGVMQPPMYDTGVGQMLVTDTNHVCGALFHGIYIQDSSGEIRCSKNDSPWSTTPTFYGHLLSFTIYRGNLYISVENIDISADIAYISVFSCPIDNCNNWQQRGSIQIFDFPVAQSHREFFSLISGARFVESTVYAQSPFMTYSQDGSGNWQVYGYYVIPRNNLLHGMVASSSGVFLAPAQLQEPWMEVYYNDVVGGDYTMIGGRIEEPGDFGASGMAFDEHNQEAYIAMGAVSNGNIYTTKKTNGSWSTWSRFGSTNPPLKQIYFHNDKLYSIYSTYDGPQGTVGLLEQVYVYSLK